jgi:uncharacterized protein (TIGR02757 family)
LRLSLEKTRSLLDGLARTYTPEFLDTDPLGVVREWDEPGDREIAGLLAAGLAYGRVASIRRSVRSAVAAMGDTPSRFVDRLDPRRAAGRFERVAHRFTTGAAVVDLLWRIRMARERAGSLERFFLDSDPAPGSPTLAPAMDAFVGRLFSLPASGLGSDAERGARWLLPAPSRGSACKRHCLFLRWMVRPDDGVDLGLWRGVSPSRLLLPLDVHLERVVVALGWTRRKSPGWPMVLDATACLRRIDPGDPVRYDFALSRLGILGLLPARGAAARPGGWAAALGA